jgi:hypothetical protein
MNKVLAIAFAAAMLTTAAAQTPAPAPAAANLNAKFFPALMNTGANNAASIVYVGKGMAAVPGAGGALAAGPAAKYTLMVNYGLMSTRTELERPAAPKRLVQAMANDIAWDVVDGKAPTLANAESVALRKLLLYMTPHGAIKAAFDPAGKRVVAMETDAKGKEVVTFTFVGGGSTYKGYLDDEGMVTKVTTLPGDPIWRNIIIEFTYSGWKDVDTMSAATVPKGSLAQAYNDVMAPTHIIQRINGNTVLDLSITEVRPNAGIYVEVPESIEKAAARR